MYIEPFPSYEQSVAELQAQKAQPWELARMSLMRAASNITKVLEAHKPLDEKDALKNIHRKINFIAAELHNDTVPLLEEYTDELADKSDMVSIQKKRTVDNHLDKIADLHREATTALLDKVKQELESFPNNHVTAEETYQYIQQGLDLISKAKEWLGKDIIQEKVV